MEHLTLGQLIKELAQYPSTLIVRFEDGASPSSLHSYRGYYERLAFEPTARDITARGVLAEARHALERGFTVYMGGIYVMHADTLLHYAQWGRLGPAIVGVERRGDVILLLTDDDDD